MPHAREILSSLCTCTFSCSSLSLRNSIVTLHMIVGHTLYYNPGWIFYYFLLTLSKINKDHTFILWECESHSSFTTLFWKNIITFFLPTTTLPFITVVQVFHHHLALLASLKTSFKISSAIRCRWYLLWSVAMMQKWQQSKTFTKEKYIKIEKYALRPP